MSPLLLIAPLLVAHLATNAHSREVRARGVVVRATATEHDGAAHADLEISAFGATQRVSFDSHGSALALLASIEIVDANFDGKPDVSVMRELFLFDGHRFNGDSRLARELSSLSNATFDFAAHTITTRNVGPANPSRITFAIDRGVLREIAACRFLNPTNPRVGTLVRTRNGHATYTETRLGAAEGDPCQ